MERFSALGRWKTIKFSSRFRVKSTSSFTHSVAAFSQLRSAPYSACWGVASVQPSVGRQCQCRDRYIFTPVLSSPTKVLRSQRANKREGARLELLFQARRWRVDWVIEGWGLDAAPLAIVAVRIRNRLHQQLLNVSTENCERSNLKWGIELTWMNEWHLPIYRSRGGRKLLPFTCDNDDDYV